MSIKPRTFLTERQIEDLIHDAAIRYVSGSSMDFARQKKYVISRLMMIQEEREFLYGALKVYLEPDEIDKILIKLKTS